MALRVVADRGLAAAAVGRVDTAARTASLSFYSELKKHENIVQSFTVFHQFWIHL
jgi:hypothetical protein